MPFRLPTNSQHVLITGQNGTGKTRLAFWLLGRSPFDTQPYIVLDWKREELFTRSDRLRELSLRDNIPTEPGVYIIRPIAGQEAELEQWLWKVWRNGTTGLYVDEGYSIDPRSPALQNILTQGRSLRIPVLYLAQRPKDISRYAISEAKFFSIFPLADTDDQKRVQQFIPRKKLDISVDLPEWHSYWYDVAAREKYIMAPVPSDEELLDYLDRRLEPKRKVS